MSLLPGLGIDVDKHIETATAPIRAELAEIRGLLTELVGIEKARDGAN